MKLQKFQPIIFNEFSFVFKLENWCCACLILPDLDLLRRFGEKLHAFVPKSSLKLAKLGQKLPENTRVLA